MFPHTTKASNHSGNDFRHARKLQTIRETTFAMRGNSKNHLGNNFRQARKYQTIRETTFAMRGNNKPYGKRLSPSAETPNLLKSELREARKRQIL